MSVLEQVAHNVSYDDQCLFILMMCVLFIYPIKLANHVQYIEFHCVADFMSIKYRVGQQGGGIENQIQRYR